MSSCRRTGHWPSQSRRQTTEKLQMDWRKVKIIRGYHISLSSLLQKEKLPRAPCFTGTMTWGAVMIWLQATLWGFIHSSWSATSTRGQQRTVGCKLWVPQLGEIKTANSGGRKRLWWKASYGSNMRKRTNRQHRPHVDLISWLQLMISFNECYRVYKERYRRTLRTGTAQRQGQGKRKMGSGHGVQLRKQHS